MPVTATAKVQKRILRAERWGGDDPVWWRREPGGPLVPMTDDDRDELRSAFEGHGRLHVLDLV
jgi:hypothetical protein